jgi:hypothetical protein
VLNKHFNVVYLSNFLCVVFFDSPPLTSGELPFNFSSFAHSSHLGIGQSQLYSKPSCSVPVIVTLFSFYQYYSFPYLSIFSVYSLVFFNFSFPASARIELVCVFSMCGLSIFVFFSLYHLQL